MSPLEYILDGLEAELALERELGVRVVECERAVLRVDAPRGGNGGCGGPSAANNLHPPSPSSTPFASHFAQTRHAVAIAQAGEQVGASAASAEAPHIVKPVASAKPIEVAKDGAIYDLVFLHHVALTGEGLEMIQKAIRAMGYELDQVPIVVEGKVPRAKVYVVLGGGALKKWMRGKVASPGNWIEWNGRQVYVTYSPVFILRFKSVTAEVKRFKSHMWTGLKGILERLKLMS